jgi:Ca-activated chloride channel family protein
MRSVVGAALVLAAVSLPAAQPLRDPRPFRTGIELTSVTATVLDGEGRLVTGLTREDFDLFEDGEPQPITQFTSERVPVSLGVLLDTSDSMHGRRLDEARAAVGRFLFELLDPADEFALVAFNHAPRVLTGWTDDTRQVRRALDALLPTGSTAVYDALLAALPLTALRNRQRSALLVISDGADTASDATLRDVRSALLRTDAFIYAIAVDPPVTPAINVRVNPQALREITDQSGGRTEVVQTTTDLIGATARIAEELNSQYLLGYSSPHGADGKYHSIRVRVRRADHRVRARNGYVATPQTSPDRQTPPRDEPRLPRRP